MNKTQLIDAVAEATDLPKAKATSVVEAVLNKITAGLVEEGQVVLVGFGTFAVKKRSARVGRDPRTGAALQIPEATAVGFKAGKTLKDAVNSEGVKTVGNKAS